MSYRVRRGLHSLEERDWRGSIWHGGSRKTCGCTRVGRCRERLLPNPGRCDAKTRRGRKGAVVVVQPRTVDRIRPFQPAWRWPPVEGTGPSGRRRRRLLSRAGLQHVPLADEYRPTFEKMGQSRTESAMSEPGPAQLEHALHRHGGPLAPPGVHQLVLDAGLPHGPRSSLQQARAGIYASSASLAHILFTRTGSCRERRDCGIHSGTHVPRLNM